MAQAPRDENRIPTMLLESSSTAGLPIAAKGDETTGRLLVDTAAGSGDVVGPASSTDNAIVRFDSTTGKLIQNSVVTIADTTGNMAGVGTLNTHTIPAGTSTLAILTNKLSDFAATTSAELATVISDETGSGALVFANSPTLVTPALGTPSALVGTNITGTGASFTAGSVTGFTPASGSLTLSGADALTLTTTAATDVTLPTTGTLITNTVATLNSLASATALAWTSMTTGTDGEIPTFDASGNPAFVAVGTVGQILTSGGVGVAPTFQDASGGGVDVQTFTGSGTWTKPASGDRVFVQSWGGGGSGGHTDNVTNAGGGGGGDYNEAWYPIADLGATETVTIGAGGASKTSGFVTGDVGGTTTFGSFQTAFGGGGGGQVGGGGGGGNVAAGSTGTNTVAGAGGGLLGGAATGVSSNFGGGGGSINNSGGDSYNGGGGGGGNSSSTSAGGDSQFGGGGGGNSGGAGGTSVHGGDGGAGTTGSSNATAGAQPGGGGGGAETGDSGAGGAGQIIVTVF